MTPEQYKHRQNGLKTLILGKEQEIERFIKNGIRTIKLANGVTGEMIGNIEPTNKGNSFDRKKQPYEDRLIPLFESGLTIMQVSRKVGKNHSLICYYFNKLKVSQGENWVERDKKLQKDKKDGN